ncbi:MAG: hypothetical protein H3Z52_00105 [archaeon]|nr:hypothetical protein [archaeon]MCP8319336.1 hypothetical protein [archaeon]
MVDSLGYGKPVNVSFPLYERWLSKHSRFLNEDVIKSIIDSTPEEERDYVNSERFKVKFRRKKNGDIVTVVLWVHEKDQEELVYKGHVQPLM